MKWLMVLLITASNAHAQAVMDGSERSISREELTAVNWFFGQILLDPYTAQLDQLTKMSNNKICGRINAKTDKGSFQGFYAFGVQLTTGAYALARSANNRATLKRTLTGAADPEAFCAR